MKVLMDDKGTVYARGEKYVIEALEKRERWAEGKTLVESWLPDDTQFERIDGGFVVSDRQPDQWESRKQSIQRIEQKREDAKTRKPSTLGERLQRIEDYLGLENESADTRD